MKSNYITKIKANIGIAASKKSTNVLDGTYVSVFTGRSMNFEDLREYVPGDNIKDIDWKASSRSGEILVKRFVAEKKHNLLFIIDTDIRMQGETNEGDIKKDVALYSYGTLAYLGYKNGDVIGSLYMAKGKPQFEPFRSGLSNLERQMSVVDAAMAERNNYHGGAIASLLEKSVSVLRRRMIITIVTDLKGASEIDEKTIKRLKCSHDVLLILIGDAHVTGGKDKVFDIGNFRYIPAFIYEDKKLKEDEERIRAELQKKVDDLTKKCGIPCVSIERSNDVTAKIINLLERNKYGYKN